MENFKVNISNQDYYKTVTYYTWFNKKYVDQLTKPIPHRQVFYYKC